MNHLETAADRRFEAELSEALGQDMPSDLHHLVMDRIGQPRQQARTAWLAAAGLLLGIVVVANVANLRDAAATSDATTLAQDAQDPQPGRAQVVVTNESLRQATARKAGGDLPPPGDAVERLLAVADSPDINLLLTAKVAGKSAVDLSGCTPSEAVERIAAELNQPLTEQHGVLIVGHAGRSGRIGQRVTLTTEPVSVRTFFQRLHAKTGINFVVAETASGTIRCDLRDVPWRVAVDSACHQLGLETVGCGTALAIRPQRPNHHARVRFLFRNTSVLKILETATRVDHKNLVIDSGVKGKLTLKCQDLPVDGIWFSLADSVRSVIDTKDGITRIAPAPKEWSADLAIENVTMHAAMSRLGNFGYSAIPKDKPRRNVSVFVRGASGRQLLHALDVASTAPPSVPAADK